MGYPIFWIPSPKYTEGHPAPLIALVHHRMVGTLRSTDSAFTSTGGREASTNFGVGYSCGIAGHPTSDAHIHQYVRLGDMAWGNGNNRYEDGRLVPSTWNSRYPTGKINSRTISIEHHDNGGRRKGNGKGVVPEKVIVASIWLDQLLLRGNLSELKDAGIRFRSGTSDEIVAELKAIPVDRHHIIDHFYISNGLKPYCWRPWADDEIGFPKARYLEALGPQPEPVPEDEVVKSYSVPKVPSLVTIPSGTWLYHFSSFEILENTDPAKGPVNRQVSPGRDMPLHGQLGTTTLIVEYVDSAGAHSGMTYFVKAVPEIVASVHPAPDLTPYSKAQLATAQAAAAKKVSDAAATAAAEFGG